MKSSHRPTAETSHSRQAAQINFNSTQVSSSLDRELVGDIYTDAYHCGLYSTDASLYQIQPVAVVLPKTSADVQTTIRFAQEHKIAIIPRGGGTSLSGQSIGPGIVIDFSQYMHRILEIDPEQQTVRVEPGVVLDHLNTRLAAYQLQFGPDVATSSRACIGGMLGNNSAGARSVRYGKMVDHVIELSGYLASGTPFRFGPTSLAEQAASQASSPEIARLHSEVMRVVAENRQEIQRRFPKILRRVSGYNLDEFLTSGMFTDLLPPEALQVRRRQRELFPGTSLNLSRLLVGAEGTLACVTEALLHVVPRPTERGVLVLHFETIAAAVAATQSLLELQPSAVELLDGEIIRLARRSLEYRRYLDFVVGEPEALVLIELSSQTRDELIATAAQMTDRLNGAPGLTHILPALEPKLRDHVWACRKASLPLLMGIPGVRKPIAFVEDAAVSPEKLSEFVARFQEIIQAHDTQGAFYGHASVGCLHIRPLLDPAQAEDRQRMQSISQQVCDLVLEFQGAMSGEHGDGLARSYLNEQLFGPQLYKAFCEIKQLFDPSGIMNPGKIVAGPSPVENLRTSQASPGAISNLKTGLSFAQEGGLLRAAELCNGAGVCRKQHTGTMCPSFMATQQEEHSTRGRANALRLVLTGALPENRLSSTALYQTYELCLSCKSCKAECPSNVDVAKLKTEFLHQYYQTHGLPWSAWLMARIGKLNRVGAAIAPFSNWAGEARLSRWLLQKLLPLPPQRPLPRFRRRGFRQWYEQHYRSQVLADRTATSSTPLSPSVSLGSRPRVVLLDDCLTSHCEPEVNQAAVEVLHAAGFDVHLADVGCCGRAALSSGDLPYARRLALQNLARLQPWLDQGVPVLGTEPSCLLTMVDEYRDLVDDDRAQKLAAGAMLVEDFLQHQQCRLPLKPVTRPAVLHGHCHQKALVGLQGTEQTLQQIPELSLQTIDSGCCGMAGAFGYEHYDLSMQIGRQRLFPAVEAMADHTVLAPGFSCRQQIAHGTGTQPLHPVQLLAAQLSISLKRV